MTHRSALFLLTILATVEPAGGQVVVTPADRSSLALTVYGDFAHVRDIRRAAPADGEATLVWTGAPGTIDPGTILLLDDQGHPVGLRGTGYSPELVSAAALLRLRIGHPVTLVGEGGERIQAVLVSADGPVFRAGDRLIVGWKGHVEVPAAGAREAPSAGAGVGPGEIRFRLAGGAGAGPLTASYLAEGLSWAADYVAVLEPDGSRMRLDGRVTVRNETDFAFPDAALQLVAGDVRRDQPPRPAAARAAEMAAMDETQEFGRAPLADFHLYTLDQPVTIGALETSMAPLFQATDVPVEREYVLRGQEYWFFSPIPEPPGPERPRIRLRFENLDVAGEGEPLPGGRLHTYVRDAAGRLQFTGEARIPHTAAGERIEVETGSAFDLVAERTQTDYRQIAENVHESAWRIEIRNRGRDDRTVVVVERMPGDWEIVEESRPHEREDARTARWEVPVSAGGSAELTYRVRVTTP